MIFVSGIHGVGKTYFCNKIANTINLKTYTASILISKYKLIYFQTDKKTVNIAENQNTLLNAIKEYIHDEEFILDGHFCLINNNGNVSRIPAQTFIDLSPSLIVLLTEENEIIAQRLKCRDNIIFDLNTIESLQFEEMAYAKEISNILNIPLYISNGSNDMDKAINYIKSFIKGDKQCQENLIG